jgi:hypothetical protein
MRKVVLRGLIAIAAAVAATRCTGWNERHLKPHVFVGSAHDCSRGNECTKVPKPMEIRLHVGHTHELDIVREEAAEIETKFTVPDIVNPEPPTMVGPNHARMPITANAVGATTLNVELTNTPPHINDRSALRIRTFSPRVTVVGWVDRTAIDPAAIAPGASETVRRYFEKRCGYTAAKIAAQGLFSKDLPFISSRSPEQDRLYAQAFLVKSSANDPPPDTVKELLEEKDFRLLNDFQVIGADGRRFAPELLRQTAVVGETPIPCGGAAKLRNAKWLRDKIDDKRPDRSERHKRDGERLEADGVERIAQLNQGRLGWLGRWFQGVLSGSDQDPADITPWVWSLVAFDEKGRYVLRNAGFPTYSVYIDGKLVQNCGTKQAKFQDFLKRDASWEFDTAGVDLAKLDFEQGGCP